VTLSLGVACVIPSSKSSIEMLIKLADNVLYLAKDNGRNQVKFITNL
jgi:two-component system, cell cycle response regulator